MGLFRCPAADAVLGADVQIEEQRQRYRNVDGMRRTKCLLSCRGAWRFWGQMFEFYARKENAQQQCAASYRNQNCIEVISSNPSQQKNRTADSAAPPSHIY